jgi:predicted MFS family arabinose efflux permease
MRIAKPLLLVMTPIGLAFGLYEGWRLAGGLVVIMAAMIALVSAAMLSVVLTVRREKRADAAARVAAAPSAHDET